MRDNNGDEIDSYVYDGTVFLTLDLLVKIKAKVININK
jgi:hypothetical protein